MYIEPLQVERTDEIGYFCNTTDKMDRKEMEEAIYNDLGVVCSITWKVIYNGSKGKMADNDKTRGLTVTVAYQDRHFALEAISEKYGTTESRFPGGRKIRFFPGWFKLQSIWAKEKFRKSLAKQRAFAKVVKDFRNGDIVALNMSAGACPSIQSVVLDMKSRKYPKVPLFISADMHWSASGDVVFQYMPQVEDEALMMVNNLPTYMKHFYGTSAEAFFSTDILCTSKKYRWDEENHRVICPTDARMEDDGSDDEDDIFGIAEAEAYLAEKKKENEKDPNPVQHATRPSLVAQGIQEDLTGVENAYF